MKISQPATSQPTSITVSPVVPKKVAPTKSQKSDKKDTSSPQTHSKIDRWFAQAGIESGTGFSADLEIAQQLARRRNISSQRKLNNLQNIYAKSLRYSSENPSSEEVDADWFFSFIDLAEHVYTVPMQELWAKIFALEVNKPGTFSINTLKTLKQLTVKDANTFQLAVSLASKRKGNFSPKLIVGFQQMPSWHRIFTLHKKHQLNLSEFGLAYPDILLLMDLGLLYKSEIESGPFSKDEITQWRCGDTHFDLLPRKNGLTLSYYKFTNTGSELAQLIPKKKATHYFEGLKELLSAGFSLG